MKMIARILYNIFIFVFRFLLCSLCCSLTKDTTNWTNKKELLEAEEAGLQQLAVAVAELNESVLAERVATAQTARDEAAQGLEAAEKEVEAAGLELSGMKFIL